MAAHSTASVASRHPIHGIQVFSSTTERDNYTYTDDDVGKVVKVSSPLAYYLVISQSGGTGTFVGLGEGITEVSDDTSPQLGGNLDIGSYALVGTAAGGSRNLLKHDGSNQLTFGADSAPMVISTVIHRAQNGHHFYAGSPGSFRAGLTTSGLELARSMYYSSEYAINESAPVTSDFSVDFVTNGPAQVVTLGANVSITSITFPTGVTRCMLTIKQDSTGGRTLSLPSAVLAPGGKTAHFVLSTAANAKDIATFYYDSSIANVVLTKDFQQ